MRLRKNDAKTRVAGVEPKASPRIKLRRGPLRCDPRHAPSPEQLSRPGLTLCLCRNSIQLEDMDFDDYEEIRQFRDAWDATSIARPVHYSLFTFGESVLPYFLVCDAPQPGNRVSVTKGEVRITRPTIITPDTARPEFQNFFEDRREEGIVDVLLARSAAFSHLKFANEQGPKRLVTDSVDETVAKLNRQLDADDEDRVAILTAPPEYAGVALLRYAAERVWASAPENVQELRERGFLP